MLEPSTARPAKNATAWSSPITDVLEPGIVSWALDWSGQSLEPPESDEVAMTMEIKHVVNTHENQSAARDGVRRGTTR